MYVMDAIDNVGQLPIAEAWLVKFRRLDLPVAQAATTQEFLGQRTGAGKCPGIETAKAEIVTGV